jgi:PhoH-like ATPase
MSKQNKLFVLDTNVIMHDPTCFFQFKEHDVLIPMCVLEELDDHKKGASEVSRNVRQAQRSLDKLMGGLKRDALVKGIILPQQGGKGTGRLFFQTERSKVELPSSLAKGKADNQIIQVVLMEQKRYVDRQVILVSKDVNMRIKATTLGIVTEDYTTDKVVEDKDVLTSSGVHMLTPLTFSDAIVPSEEGDEKHTTVGGAVAKKLFINEFVVVQHDYDALHHHYVIRKTKNTAVLQKTCSYRAPTHSVCGIVARNAEQSCALSLLMNPEIDLVTLLGPAGTGKTLLTLAAALEQCMERKLYEEIIVTRATIPLGEDIGFLPGTEEEKMGPWFGALTDNLRVLIKPPKLNKPHHFGPEPEVQWGEKATKDFMSKYVSVKNMSYMRGRTFQNKFLIFDEAQNFTPKQMKALITRAGPGTKVVCMGNLSQIDSPYLTEWTSGLTNVVLRFRGWPRFGSIILKQGERSPLADYANEVL